MHSITQWSNYFIAIAGAAAALTGFLFIGLTMSFNKFQAYKYLPSRALQSLLFLLTILIVSTLGLVPGESYTIFGIEVLFMGVFTFVVNYALHYNMHKQIEKKHKKYLRINIFFTQLANLPYILAGIIILLYGYCGIYWLVPAFFFSFVKALIDSWVLIVEVNR